MFWMPRVGKVLALFITFQRCLHFWKGLAYIQKADLLDPRIERGAARLALHRLEFELEKYSLFVLQENCKYIRAGA